MNSSGYSLLDIDDNTAVAPIFEFASIQGIEVENEHGKLNRATWVLPKSLRTTSYSARLHFKKKGKVSISYSSRKRPLQFTDTIDMLWTFQIKTWNTVQLLADFVITELEEEQ